MTRPFTRRELLGAGAAAGAALALPSGVTAAGRKARRKRSVEVVIVGAGLAGLTAARELTKAGHEVCVLEARDRVGGRTLNHHVSKGVIAEAGGQFIGPTQHRIAALAKEVGVKTFKTYNRGEDLLYARGRLSRYPASGLPPDPDVQQAVIAAVTQLDTMAAKVPLDAPWKARRAAEWDAMTLEDWKQANVTTEVGRQAVTTAAYAVWAADPSQLSLLYVLWYIAGSGDSKTRGSFARLVTTQGGSQERRFVGGSQLISQKVAQKLGSRVVLSSPVRGIHQAGSGVTVSSDRLIVHAKQAIVAIPPVLLAGIDFSPELPRLRRNLARRTVPGHLIKWEALYDRPFWRDAGLSGQVISDVGPARSTFDNTPPGGKPGIMFAFIGGADADAFGKLSASDRSAAVLGQFATYFGPAAATPIDSFEMDWSTEPWTRGCPVGHMGPGTLRRFGPALRMPFKRVHLAGSEVATWWAGYMDGAVRSGETAARDVARALKK